MRRPTDVLDLNITARHILDNLSNDLYKDHGDCLWELVRNSLIACMLPDKWEPKRAHVEVNLCRNHPLSPDATALEVFDKGCGIPLARLRNVGPSMDDIPTSNRHHGAAQKRIGRFAGLSLNRRCYDDRDVETGMYILTRTTVSGQVTLVSLIPALLEQRKPVISTIDPDSIELGPRRGTKGTFTSIVIPYSVFKTDAEIREAMRWKIPRKASLMFKLSIGGKDMVPPPLVSGITDGTEGDFAVEAYIDKVDDSKVAEGGIWLTDAATGLRVAFVPNMSAHLSYPLVRHDLVGDIFVPGLLKNQDASRSGLNGKFLKSAEWKRTWKFLEAKIVPAAKALLGDTDVFHRNNPVEKTALDFVELCNKAFGDPENVDGPPFDQSTRGKLPSAPTTPTGPKGVPSKTPLGGSGGSSPKPYNPKPRVLPFNVDGKTYLLAKLPADPKIFASMDPTRRGVVNLNSQYVALPRQKDARLEHVVCMILAAIANDKFRSDAFKATRWAAEQREKLGGCQTATNL